MEIQTDLLIIGTGPAGAGLACFLASYGLKGIMIGDSFGGITTPRAHITNMAALECLRDIGLEEDCQRVATQRENMEHTRWCYSMTGEEFARIHSWGNDPKRAGDYFAASPCNHSDLPQTELEPILVRYATTNGFVCRFNSTFLNFQRNAPDDIVSTIRDDLSGNTYTIRSRYLFGCDGARSRIITQLDLPLLKKPGQGLALNVLVHADLSEYMRTRTGNLHWVMQPDRIHPDFGQSAIVRMVKPWFEWVFIIFPDPSKGLGFSPSEETCLERVKEMIGDDSIPVKIIDLSKWYINEIVAERYSDGNILCLGDAVHRHPPFNGLGSNTCIQDAYNLAWKLAYVLDGRADARLLDSFSLERQPVGLSVITRANQGFREHLPIWEALGMMDPDINVRKKEFRELGEAGAAGEARRKKLRDAVEDTAHEFHGLGVEMNQRYESEAIYLDDEGPRPPLPEDPVLEHQISTYPGSRLPHAWLNSARPGKPMSTIDLAGHRNFCLLTGIGGEDWKVAAIDVSNELGLKISAYSIGWRQDYEDTYFDWAKRREVGEDGCILVRPDRFVAWRSRQMISDCKGKLMTVMRRILGHP